MKKIDRVEMRVSPEMKETIKKLAELEGLNGISELLSMLVIEKAQKHGLIARGAK